MRARQVRLLVALGMAGALIACSGPSPSDGDPPNPAGAEVTPLAPPDGAALFLIACAGCHRIEAGGPHDVGPNLHGIIGQAAAGQADYNYSAALAGSGLSWDRGTLAAWIAATETLVPGTFMSYANILDGHEVGRVIDHLFETAVDQGAINLPPPGEQDEQ